MSKQPQAQPSQSKQLSLHESIAGGLGGFCQVMVGHPFDTIKVRMQTQEHAKSAFITLSNLVKNESAFALYKGVQSPIMGIAFCNSVLFAANGQFRQYLLDPQLLHDEQLDRVVLAGMASGCVMAFVNCPVELLKVRLQIQDHSKETHRYRGLLHCAWLTVKADGIFGLYRGLLPTMLRELPSFAAYFGAYEACKGYFAQKGMKDSPIALLISGGMAGIAAWLPCYPQDVLKSRIQSSAHPITLREAARSLYATSGIKGFWKGFGPTMCRAFPANAATFLGYELAIKYMQQHSLDDHNPSGS